MESKYQVGHIAFVVQDLDAAMDFMKSIGAEVSEKKQFENKKHDLNDADHWTVTYCKGSLGSLGFEIFHPDGPGTPYSEFLEKTGGGIHHMSFDDLGDDIEAMRDDLVSKGARQISSAESRKYGLMACYMDLPALSGTIVELKK